jgi:hypothetical protein
MSWTRIAAGVVIGLVVLVVAAIVALNSIDWSRYQEPVVARVKEATGRDLAVEGALRLRLGFTPAVTVEGVRFANADWGTRPDMLEVERFEVQLALWPLLFRRVEVRRVVLSGAVIWLEVDADGRGNWVFETASDDSETSVSESEPVPAPPSSSEEPAGGAAPAEEDPAAQFFALIHEVVIERSQFVYRDAASGARQELDIDELSLRMADVTAPLEVEASLVYNGEPIEARASVGGADAITAGGAIDLDADVRVGGATITATGPIEHPLEGRGFALALSANGDSLATLSGLAGSSIPALGPYRFAARASDGDGLYRLEDLQVDVGESMIRGSVVARTEGPRPRVEAALTSSILRAADFRQEAPAPAAGEGTATPSTPAESPAATAPALEDEEHGEAPRLFSSEPLPLDGLSAADADVTFDIDVLEVDDLVLRAVELGLRLDDRQLDLRPLRAELAGGALDARVSLAAREAVPALDVKATLDKLDSGQLLRALEVTDVLTGARVDARIDVAGRGQSVAAIMASLGGDIATEVGPGSIRRDWAEAQLGDWAPLILGDAERGKSKGSASLNCVVARFQATDGVAESEGIAIDTPILAVLGDGEIDFRSEEVDLALEPVVKELDAGLVTPPAAVEGPLSAPEFGLDRDAVADKALGIALALASGDSVAGGKDIRTSEGVDGCNELIARSRELTGSGGRASAEKQAKKKVKKEVRKAKKKLRKEGLKELEGLLD